jgi:GMP synthase (glutamine-hydrolysing)
MSRTITVIQHHPAEGAGRIGHWATARGFVLDVRRAQEDGSHLDAPGDALIVLGGPQSAVEPPPWLASQIAWLHEQHGTRPVLGLCLGAQSLAVACGGSVRPLGTQELGWTPVAFGREAGPRTLDVLQWHSDTFDLPPGAVPLASGAACPAQGYRLGRSVGLQFHPEWDPPTLAAMREAFGALPFDGIDDATRHAAVEAWFMGFLDRWIDGAA